MKTMKCMSILLVIATAIGSPVVSHAAEVTMDEAQAVAENYLKLTLAREGLWGTHESAYVAGIEPFVQGDVLLGYFCPVEPEGCLVLGRYRELAPIRFYSVRGRLDPTAEEGMTDFLKDRTAALYGAIERRLGRSIDPQEDFGEILPAVYQDAWEILSNPDYIPTADREAPKMRSAGMDYQPGETLLDPEMKWHQRPPYNEQCPDGGCDWTGMYPGYTGTNVRVGCVGTAGSMIMKHWNWPPFGFGGGYDDPYDWSNMKIRYDWDIEHNHFHKLEDGVWSPATQAELDAVSELNWEFSWACDTSYGCGSSSVSGTDPIVGAFTWFYYYWNGCGVTWKVDNTFAEYWLKLKNEFNINRPVMYLIPGHAIVADGWKEEWIDNPTFGLHYEWMHINYGWGGSNNGWCPPSEVPEGDFSEEGFVRDIIPNTAIGNLIGDYELPGAGPYRYFQIDSTCYDANVAPGHRLQALRSGFLLSHLYGDGPAVIYGEPGLDTVLFLEGDPVNESRIRINDGQMKITNGGQLALY